MQTISSLCSAEKFHSDVESKPRPKLHSYVDTSISCSYSRISLPVDGAQNHHGLWRIPAKDKPLRQTKIDQKISWPCSCLLLQGCLASKRQTCTSKVQPKHTVLSEDWQSKCQVLTLKRLVEGTSKRRRTKLQFVIVWHKEHQYHEISSSLVISDNKIYHTYGIFLLHLCCTVTFR